MFLQQYNPVFYDHRGELEIITRTLSGFAYTVWAFVIFYQCSYKTR